MSTVSENENPEITDTLEKHHKTEIGKCNLKNSRNDVQITSNSQIFSQITNNEAGSILSVSDSSRVIKLSPFLFISILTHKKIQILI